MNQDEINQREHENPANWGSPFAFYHSKLDSRLWVPKQRAWMGRTLNLARPLSKVLALAFVIVLVLCLAAAAVVFGILLR